MLRLKLFQAGDDAWLPVEKASRALKNITRAANLDVVRENGKDYYAGSVAGFNDLQKKVIFVPDYDASRKPRAFVNHEDLVDADDEHGCPTHIAFNPVVVAGMAHAAIQQAYPDADTLTRVKVLRFSMLPASQQPQGEVVRIGALVHDSLGEGKCWCIFVPNTRRLMCIPLRDATYTG